MPLLNQSTELRDVLEYCGVLCIRPSGADVYSRGGRRAILFASGAPVTAMRCCTLFGALAARWYEYAPESETKPTTWATSTVAIHTERGWADRVAPAWPL